jgi:hypothetical protein
MKQRIVMVLVFGTMKRKTVISNAQLQILLAMQNFFVSIAIRKLDIPKMYITMAHIARYLITNGLCTK